MSALTRAEERIRFDQFGLRRLDSGEFEATVTLVWGAGPSIQGTARSADPDSGELHCSAQACLNALAEVSRDTSFQLLGVKSVQAFDATVVIVSVAMAGQSGGPRLVGSYLAGADLPRGAALAVLNATNRVIATRPFQAA